jgi:hypothetical protein
VRRSIAGRDASAKRGGRLDKVAFRSWQWLTAALAQPERSVIVFS